MNFPRIFVVFAVFVVFVCRQAEHRGNHIRRPPARETKLIAPDVAVMTDFVMMTGRAYEKRRVQWHGAYFAEELVLVGAPADV